MDNANSKEYLEKILTQVLENLKRTAHAPSVQMTDVPRESLGMNDEDEAALDDLDEDQNADSRMSQRKADKYVEKNGELSDSEDEAMEAMDGHAGSRKRRIMVNYRHIMDVGGNDSGMETGSGIDTPQQGSSLPDDADEMNVDELDEKINLIPSPSAADMNGSAAMSGQHSPSAPAADDDIEMGDADAEGSAPTSAADALLAEEESTITVQPQAQQQQTPPESPPAQEAEQLATTSGDTALTATEGEAAMVDPAAVTLTATATTEPDATGASIEEAAIKQEVTGDDEVAKAQEEGRMEREAVNAEGEARTEAVARAETDGRPEDEL